MLSFKSISYEEMRLEYFRKQRDAAERRMNYWCRPKQADRVGWMEASDRASEAGAQYNFYEDALKALKNQPKWISVEERLPEIEKDVLTLHRGKYRCIGYYSEDCGLWILNDAPVYDETVTHWMPLPEPPKEEA